MIVATISILLLCFYVVGEENFFFLHHAFLSSIKNIPPVTLILKSFNFS